MFDATGASFDDLMVLRLGRVQPIKATDKYSTMYSDLVAKPIKETHE